MSTPTSFTTSRPGRLTTGRLPFARPQLTGNAQFRVPSLTATPFSLLPTEGKKLSLRRLLSTQGKLTVEDSEPSSTERSGGIAEHAIPQGHLHTASALHAFNRYEIKYLAEEQAVDAIREELLARMDADEYSPRGGYPVLSLYYDTSDLRFYWEKIEGLKFRRKLRIRLYDDPRDCVDTTPVFVEIKQRVNRVTQKRRIRVPYSVARQLCDEREPIEHDERQRPFVNEVSTMIGNLDLRPVVTTGYRREAYVGRDADLGLRVTIDHRIHGRDRDFELVHRPDCTDEYVRRTAFQVLPERSSI